MTDLEINKALALAIGWREADMPTVRTYTGPTSIWICTNDGRWNRFDYRYWSVISPIAERYNAFPSQYQHFMPYEGTWESHAVVNGKYAMARADTPQKAIALAVIGGVK